jgi:FAD/FMN-containing dehydrogenase
VTSRPPLKDAGPALLARLEAELGPEGLRPAAPRYLEEPRGRYHGRAAAVLRPASVEDVAAAVRLSAAARVGIVPWSGGTGLVGGQVFETGPLPVLMSFERMPRIRDLDLTDNVLVAEAGAVLADVRDAARQAGRLFPLSLASEGSARIGGLLGTNAGGVNVLRYGNARDLCLGIEAVLADGTVLNGLGIGRCFVDDDNVFMTKAIHSGMLEDGAEGKAGSAVLTTIDVAVTGSGEPLASVVREIGAAGGAAAFFIPTHVYNPGNRLGNFEVAFEVWDKNNWTGMAKIKSTSMTETYNNRDYSPWTGAEWLGSPNYAFTVTLFCK